MTTASVQTSLLFPPVRLVALVCGVLLLSGCACEGGCKLPGVYRIDVQQGNVIEQEMLDKLKPGMDKNQVRFIMGTPVLVDPFHADRWEYVFTYSEGGARREQRHVILHFREEKLAYVEGDVITALPRPEDADPIPHASAVEVPLKDDRPGFFSRMFNSIPFVGEDEKKTREAELEKAQEEQTESEPAAGGQVQEELPLP